MNRRWSTLHGRWAIAALTLGTLTLMMASIAPAQAQSNCDAEFQFKSAACTGQMERCITITVNVDPNGKKFIHEWNMGDGKTLRGKTVEHCYETFGTYHVVMSLIDSVDGHRIENELSRDLLIAPLPAINPSQLGLGVPVEAGYTYEPLPGFVTQKVFWDFGDGNFACGQKPSFIYDSAGTFTQRVLLQGMVGDMPFAVCNSKAIAVRGPNVKAKVLTEWFVALEKKMPENGRFLKDVTHLALLNEAGQLINAIALTTKDVFVYIKPRTNYTIYSWRGNLFSKSTSFNSGAEADADENLHQAILKITEGDPIPFPAFTFDLDKSMAQSSLTEHVAVLNQYPFLFVDIGAYTHTGGRMERNGNLSKERSAWLKQRLVELGIAPERLRSVSVDDDKRLLNTCTGSTSCTWEDERFNRKAEFRMATPTFTTN